MLTDIIPGVERWPLIPSLLGLQAEKMTATFLTTHILHIYYPPLFFIRLSVISPSAVLLLTTTNVLQ